MKLLIEHARIITETQIIDDGWLLADSGRVEDYGDMPAPPIDADTQINGGGNLLMPGFIDLHVHGAVGHDTMDANPEGLADMARFYARHGVTGFLATTWTDSAERIYAAMKAAAQMPQHVEGGAEMLGVYMEGPFLNAEYCGAQAPEHIRWATPDEMARLFDLGVIRIVALAPEFSKNHWLIRACRERGIQVSIAHSGASYEAVMAAVEMGLGHATHTFNAMTGLHHREPGAVGAILTTPSIKAEIIADNIHVHPAVMKLLWQMKGEDGVIAITDAIRATGLADGTYMLDNRQISVKDGACRLENGTLAGSILTMDAALRNLAAATGERIEHLWRAVSFNAAKAIGLDERKGSIAKQKDADLVLLTPQSEVICTIVSGKVAYQRTAQHVLGTRNP